MDPGAAPDQKPPLTLKKTPSCLKRQNSTCHGHRDLVNEPSGSVLASWAGCDPLGGKAELPAAPRTARALVPCRGTWTCGTVAFVLQPATWLSPTRAISWKIEIVIYFPAVETFGGFYPLVF